MLASLFLLHVSGRVYYCTELTLESDFSTVWCHVLNPCDRFRLVPFYNFFFLHFLKASMCVTSGPQGAQWRNTRVLGKTSAPARFCECWDSPTHTAEVAIAIKPVYVCLCGQERTGPVHFLSLITVDTNMVLCREYMDKAERNVEHCSNGLFDIWSQCQIIVLDWFPKRCCKVINSCLVMSFRLC